MTLSKRRLPFLFTSCFVGMLLATSAAAAVTCKGMEQNQCTKQDQCSWVDAYTRSDGAKVRGYCRTRSVSKSASNKLTKDQVAKQKGSSSSTGSTKK